MGLTAKEQISSHGGWTDGDAGAHERQVRCIYLAGARRGFRSLAGVGRLSKGIYIPPSSPADAPRLCRLLRASYAALPGAHAPGTCMQALMQALRAWAQAPPVRVARSSEAGAGHIN